MNRNVEGGNQRRRLQHLRLVERPVPEVREEERRHRERRQEEPQRGSKVSWQPLEGPPREQVADEDAEAIRAEVLVGGEVRVAELLFDSTDVGPS